MIYKIIVDKQPSTNPTVDKKEYTIDIEELRFLGDVYDSLVITKDEDYVIRRLSLSEYNVLSVLAEPIKETLSDINIELFEGDNYVYLADMTGNKFYAKYIIKNDFTDTYVTVNQMNSSITQTAGQIVLSVNQILTGYDTSTEVNSKIEQTANSITSTVNQILTGYDTSTEVNSKIEQTANSITSTVSQKVGNDEVISKINQTAESVTINANKIGLTANNVLDILAGNTINMTSKNIAISSDNFSVTKNGKMTCSDAEITGGNIKLSGNNSSALFRVMTSAEDTAYMSFVTPTQFVTRYGNDNRVVIGSNSPNIEVHDASSETDINPWGIVTPSLTQTSKASQKKNFELLQNALDIIKSIDIYKYNLKCQNEGEKKHIGFIIGEDFNYSEEVTSSNNDGVDIYSFVAVCCKAIQEQQETINDLETRLARLEEKYG